MSRYEWEQGSIKLPSDQATAFKQEFRRHATAYRDRLKVLADVFWQANKRKTVSDQMIWEFADKQTGVGYELNWLLNMAQGRKVTEAMLDKVLFPRPTNRSNEFRIEEATLIFKGNELYWSVDENNHACERAHDHPLWSKLFWMLGAVRWTARSGGTIVGNDEYNRDSRDYGGGGNYVTAQFGKKVVAHWR